MAYLHHVPPAIGDGAAIAAKAIGGIILAGAYAATDAAPAIEPLADWLHIRPNTLWCALLGSMMFLLLDRAPALDRIKGAVVALIGTYLWAGGLMQLFGVQSQEVERMIGGVGGLIGGPLISAALRRAEGGADRIVDFGVRMIGRRVGVEIPPPKGGADAGS